MKITLEQMIAAAIHLGHPKCQWNPKIAPYIYGVYKGSHLIDLVQTRQQIRKARQFVIDVTSEGKDVLFVGTKKQATKAIKEVSIASQSFFVNKRWLGGILTNWSTIQVSLLQLHRIEREQHEGSWHSLPKKKVSFLKKRLNRLEHYFGGLKGIRFFPGVVVIVGQKREWVAIQECRKLAIPTLCRLDTDCDPTVVELGVAINDDSETGITLFLETILPRIQAGRCRWISKK
jgi:small subunit ribosomal protein S2